MKNIAIVLLFVFSAFSEKFQQVDKWKAPESTDKIENPIAKDPVSESKGKEIYTKLCWSCHGDAGKGDGPASANLKIKPADFTSEEFLKQTDGAVFYKISEGRGNMASYKNLLSAKQRWQTINYLRTLK